MQTQAVCHFSDNETIYPGDLLGTGTIGLAASMDTHRWIKAGQTATFTLEGIGSMSLKVVPGEHVTDHVNGMNGLIPPPGK